jgi:hypothetical protein
VSPCALTLTLLDDLSWSHSDLAGAAERLEEPGRGSGKLVRRRLEPRDAGRRARES